MEEVMMGNAIMIDGMKKIYRLDITF